MIIVHGKSLRSRDSKRDLVAIVRLVFATTGMQSFTKIAV